MAGNFRIERPFILVLFLEPDLQEKHALRVSSPCLPGAYFLEARRRKSLMLLAKLTVNPHS
jgi:hypothetical protein